VDLLKEEILTELIPEDDKEYETKMAMFNRYFHEVEKRLSETLSWRKGSGWTADIMMK